MTRTKWSIWYAEYQTNIGSIRCHAAQFPRNLNCWKIQSQSPQTNFHRLHQFIFSFCLITFELFWTSIPIRIYHVIYCWVSQFFTYKTMKYFTFSLLLVFTREFFIGKMKTKRSIQNSHYSHRRVKATQIFTMSLCYVLSHLWFQQAFIFWYFHVRFANGAVSQILRNIFIPKLGFSSKTWLSRFSGQLSSSLF